MTTLATAQEQRINGTKGIGIFVRSWRPQSKPRAVIVICHGVNSHSGQYVWVAEQLADSGLAVYALDLRGRGRSDGERFYVEDVADYVSDVAGTVATAKSRHPGVPVFLLGHSAGGVVSATYVLDHQRELAGFICESFAFQVPAPGFALAAIKGLSHIAPRLPVLKLKNEDFSRDPKAVDALNNDPLIAHEVQPAITVAALVRADERLREEFSRITLPTLIMHGTADRATVCHGSEFFYKTAGSSDKTLRLYEGHYHDLLNDIGKEGVMADIKAWVDSHVPARSLCGVSSGVRAAAVACGLSLLAGHSAYAQTSSAAGRPRFQAGVSFVQAFAVGDFSERVNLAAGGLFQLDVGVGDSIFSVGGEIGYMGYGHANRKVDVSSLIPEIPNATLSVSTTNYMVPMHARVRAQRRVGRWRPHADALFGGNLISTDTSIDCSANNDSTCSGDNSATNAEDFVLNIGGGGGVLIAFSERPRVPQLDVSFRYLRGGEATYLTKGAIRREGSTAIFDLSRSRTDMVALYIGAVFGL